MVKLGTLNSRMKDFYDIWLLSRQSSFDGPTLARALVATFANRKTAIEVNPVALTTIFSESSTAETQWRAFVRKGRLGDAPEHLLETTTHLATFLAPVAEGAQRGEFNMRWDPRGPWQPKA
jgi:hypothetical protein